MNSDYYVTRGETMQEVIEKLSSFDKDDLVKLIVNNRLNDFIAKGADYSDADKDPHGHGKRIPYIGWFWRSTDFVGKNITIGDCGHFIGVMENNKWGYRERYLTEEEADKVVSIIWEAKRLSEKGGETRTILKNKLEKLDELWDLFQTFHV